MNPSILALVDSETYFHHFEGGQPADLGVIECSNKNFVLNVNFVAFVNDKVHHYIKEDLNDDLKEQEVALKIDQERRLLNAKSHTSGLVLEK